MKKLYLIISFLLCLNIAFGQWTRINAIPSRDIVALMVNNNTMYAASHTNLIYKSADEGISWTALIVGPDTVNINALKFYHNILFAGTRNRGVFFSSDNGNTWQNNGTGPDNISNFSIKNDILYAAILGDGVAVMNAANNTWSFFNNDLPFYSFVVQGIISSPNFLLITAGVNGTVYRYNFNNNSWNEEFYDGILHPGVAIDNFISSGDSLFAVNFDRIITSTNAGATWTNDKLGTHKGSYRYIHEGTNNYYTITYKAFTDALPAGTWIQQRSKNAPVGSTWSTGEEFLPGPLSYAIIEFNNKLFLAKNDGLFFKNLPIVILPIRFISFGINCDKDKVTINWKTAQEQNSSHFNIERSADGIRWTVTGSLPAAGNSANERSYLFTDNNPVQNAYYRIAEYDLDGRVQYTGILRSSCVITDVFTLFPNPLHDRVFINIVAGNESQATIRLFDNKGALVKAQKTTVLQGRNQFNIDMRLLANGVYQLSVSWNNGQFQKTTQVLKQ